jgi:hypothetical protein
MSAMLRASAIAPFMYLACCSAIVSADTPQELLLRRIGALRGELEAIGGQITELERKMPVVETAIDQLTERLGSLQMRQSDEKVPEAASGKPQLVGFRPPILHTVTGNLEFPIVIVCQNRSVKIVDLEQKSEALKAIVNDSSKLEAFRQAKGGTLPAGDFDMQITINSLFVEQQLVERENVKGETMETARQPSSRVQQRLRKIEPGKAILQFAVYPDSFDLFRALRSSVWEQNHGSIKWILMQHGEKLNFSAAGSGGVGVQ